MGKAEEIEEEEEERINSLKNKKIIKAFDFEFFASVLYTANNYCHCTANRGVTFLTVIWQYSELLMAVLRDADGSNRNSLLSLQSLAMKLDFHWVCKINYYSH